MSTAYNFCNDIVWIRGSGYKTTRFRLVFRWVFRRPGCGRIHCLPGHALTSMDTECRLQGRFNESFWVKQFMDKCAFQRIPLRSANGVGGLPCRQIRGLEETGTESNARSVLTNLKLYSRSFPLLVVETDASKDVMDLALNPAHSDGEGQCISGSGLRLFSPVSSHPSMSPLGETPISPRAEVNAYVIVNDLYIAHLSVFRYPLFLDMPTFSSVEAQRAHRVSFANYRQLAELNEVCPSTPHLSVCYLPPLHLGSTTVLLFDLPVEAGSKRNAGERGSKPIVTHSLILMEPIGVALVLLVVGHEKVEKVSYDTAPRLQTNVLDSWKVPGYRQIPARLNTPVGRSSILSSKVNLKLSFMESQSIVLVKTSYDTAESHSIVLVRAPILWSIVPVRTSEFARLPIEDLEDRGCSFYGFTCTKCGSLKHQMPK
ncbi:hypothetical protein EDC04DRAFT_3088737 [Pisolithus marmoratus]|nr:hypothetical protein EDC04DRAFT_3088737 [Pisolithus marmoratus]